MTDEAEAAQEEYAPEVPAPETPSEDDFSADDLFDADGNPLDETAPEQVEPVAEPEPVAYPQEADEQPGDLIKEQTDVYEEPAPKEFAEAEPPQDEIADVPEETAVQKPALPVEDADEPPLPPQEDEPDEPEASPAPFDIFASEDDASDSEPPLPPENDDAPSASEDFAEAAQEQGEPEKPTEVQPASFWDEAQTSQSEEPPAMTTGTDELLSFLQVADETSLSPALPPQQPEASAHTMKNTLNLAVSPLALGMSEFHPFETQSQNFVPEISKRPVALFGLTDFQDG